MTTRKFTWCAVLIGTMALAAATASAQVQMASSVIGSGGSSATAGGILLNGTIGQAIIGPSSGSTINAWQGFWYMIPALPSLSVPGSEAIADGVEMQSWPNPFSQQTRLQVRVATPGPVSIKLYNTLGNEVRTLFEGQHEAGIISIEIEAAKLESGTYTAQLVAGTVHHAIKLVVLK